MRYTVSLAMIEDGPWHGAQGPLRRLGPDADRLYTGANVPAKIIQASAVLASRLRMI